MNDAIELEDVRVDVPGKRILDGISWRLAAGQRAAILGPNGCGKSTLLRTITGYGHITSGRVRVLGEELGKTEIHVLRRRLGVVDPKLTRLLDPGITTGALVATGLFGHLTTFFDHPSASQLELAGQALEEAGVGSIVDQPFETLSSGQFSRAWLARALISDPELLILDEPGADLDWLGRESLLTGLQELCERKPQISVVTVTHHLEDVSPDTDHVLLLRRGQVSALGPPQEVLTDQLLSAAYGGPIRVEQQHGRWRFGVSVG